MLPQRKGNPAWENYWTAMKAQFGGEELIMVHTTISLMPDDPDGIWSMLDDFGAYADIDTLVDLCRRYKSYLGEYNRV